MQKRIKRAGTQFVPMSAEFLDHLKAVDRLLACVVQHMEANEAGIEIPVIHDWRGLGGASWPALSGSDGQTCTRAKSKVVSTFDNRMSLSYIDSDMPTTYFE